VLVLKICPFNYFHLNPMRIPLNICTIKYMNRIEDTIMYWPWKYIILFLCVTNIFFWKLGIRSKNRLIRGDQSHRPPAICFEILWLLESPLCSILWLVCFILERSLLGRFILSSEPLGGVSLFAQGWWSTAPQARVLEQGEVITFNYNH